MKKRIFALLFCLAMAVSLVACTVDTPSTNPDTSTAVGSTDTSSAAHQTDNTTDSETSDTTSEEPVVLQTFDPDMEHKVIACDVTNHSIVIFDLNACDGDYEKLKDDAVSVVWEWDAEEDPYHMVGGVSYGIASAKYRYSPYYGEDVIVACSSHGWCGVISYANKRVLWETRLQDGPHSIEMLPNGDVVVAVSSSPKGLFYIPLSAGAKEPVHDIDSPSCHGVCWDPINECLWVLERTGVYPVTIENMGTKNGKLVRGESTFFRGDGDGHAFSPVYGEPGKYWVGAHSNLWVFDSEEKTMTKADRGSTTNIKGVCSFSDGTLVSVAYKSGDPHGWACTEITIIRKELSTGKVKRVMNKTYTVTFDEAQRCFYKVQPFTKDYQ